MQSAGSQDHLWIVVGDIHDEAERFDTIPDISRANGIIVSGDLTVEGGVPQAERVMNSLCAFNLPVLAQIGNMDRPEIDAWLTDKDWNLHTVMRELTPEVAAFGVGGSTPTPFSTPSEFSESDVAAWLEASWRKVCAYPHQVLVSHNPPKDTACDVIPGNVHVGSTAVREFLEKAQPEICVCGHIHEARAIDRVGRTLVINPGMLAQGGYVLLRYTRGHLEAELKLLPD
ncbi:MAG: metallophosphoesterase family protein [Desulfovibrio sp.]|nr:metallophosphoesterase family protein [Desulfovibrio sp.]